MSRRSASINELMGWLGCFINVWHCEGPVLHYGASVTEKTLGTICKEKGTLRRHCGGLSYIMVLVILEDHLELFVKRGEL